MRNLPINKAVVCWAVSLITTGLLASSTVLAMPLQGAVSATARSVKEPEVQAKIATGSITKSPVLVRNTTTKTEPVVKTTATTAVQQKHDTKTIGRCWKRLMSMVREVSHARHTKNS